jgi:uncharacterized membrane protein YkoI
MTSLLERRVFIGIASLALLGLAGATVTVASQQAFAGGGNETCATQDADESEGHEESEAEDPNDTDNVELECEDGESESAAQPGTLDDGKELLPQASITVEQAISAAQAAASGPVGEIDLEHYKGILVFNVDVGDSDVKVDAANGSVLAVGED